MSQNDEKRTIRVTAEEEYDEDFVSTAADHRIFFDILNRSGAQQWIPLLLTAYRLHDELQNAGDNPGEFFRQEEQSPTSPDYLNIAWSEVTVPNRDALRTGYRAAERFADCIKYALMWGLHGEISDAKLEIIRSLADRAIQKLASLPKQE